jgi:hypothetical protein
MFDTRSGGNVMHQRQGRVLSVLVVAVLSLFATPAILAGSVGLAPVRDCTLIEDPEGTSANGSGPHLFAGRNSEAAARRALLRFDVASQVPPGSIVTGVVLTLHMSQTNAGAEFVSLHRVAADWGEGASNASGGSGAPSQPGDATWIHTFHDGGFWAAAGGDFTASSASAAVDAPAFYTWGSTPEMVADVQHWLDDPTGNHGWLLRGNEATAPTVKRFASREHTDPRLRPVLAVEFVQVDDESDDESDDEE